jgi:hypothetical protein
LGTFANLLPETTTLELNLISNEDKIFITLSNNIYHFHNDCIGSLLKQYSLTKNAKIIIDISMFEHKKDSSFYNFFFKVLNDNNINYEIINCNLLSKIVSNNFYIMDKFYPAINDAPNIIFNLYKNYIKNINAKPYKKVYISRKNNSRVANNLELENYLQTKGFEIIFPENFINFQEQLNYFYDVKTLISVTGSGLTNGLFMQSNTNIVELITPFNISYPLLNNKISTEVHHFYSLNAFIKKQKYFGISNNNNDIVKQLNDIMVALNE